MASRTHRLLLRCAISDRTFELERAGERWLLVGKCIHCGTKLALGLDGKPVSNATIEHILPRTHGGTDDDENLAIACAPCNAQKGYRHDVRRANDPKLVSLVELLSARRRARYRDPPLALPTSPSAAREGAARPSRRNRS